MLDHAKLYQTISTLDQPYIIIPSLGAQHFNKDQELNN